MKDEPFDIINKKIDSYYRNFSLEICKEVGSRKAGIPMVLMNRFEKLRVSKKIFLTYKIYIKYICIVGISWFKGLNIISDILSEIFLFNNILTYNLTHPQNPVDFLQEILVSETTLRLKRQHNT